MGGLLAGRSSGFRWLWCSTLASSGAMGVERTATAWLALEAGGAVGALAVGLAFAARMLPSLLFGLAAGTLADRTDRRRQLVLVAAAGIPLMLAVSGLAWWGRLQVWQVVAFAFAAGCLQVFDTPARQALILDSVPRDVAANAVALNAVGARLSAAFGALASGLLIASFGAASCYPAVAALFGLAALAAAGLRPPRRHEVRGAPPPFGQALRAAARLLVDLPAVRALSVAGIVCEIFAFSYATALPVLARDVLAAGAEGLGTLNAAASVGGTLAVVALTVLPRSVRREPLLSAVFLLYGVAILALAASGGMGVALAALVLIGACGAAFDALQQTLLQLAVHDEQRGRAVGIWVLGLGSAPVGHLEIGALAAALGAPSALAINGVLVVASAAVMAARASAYRWAPAGANPPSGR
jgi:MFS family permease